MMRQQINRREFLGALAGVGVTSAAFRAWCAEHGADFDFASAAAECGWNPGASGDSPRKTLVKRHFAHFEERIENNETEGKGLMRMLCGTILAAVAVAAGLTFGAA